MKYLHGTYDQVHTQISTKSVRIATMSTTRTTAKFIRFRINNDENIKLVVNTDKKH